MRCLECNTILTDEEAVHKNRKGEYTDMCFMCLYGDHPGEDDSIDPDELAFDEDQS